MDTLSVNESRVLSRIIRAMRRAGRPLDESSAIDCQDILDNATDFAHLFIMEHKGLVILESYATDDVWRVPLTRVRLAPDVLEWARLSH